MRNQSMKKNTRRSFGALLVILTVTVLMYGCSDMITSLLATIDARVDAAALSTDNITFDSGDTADAVTGDFTLPTVGESDTTTISWESGNTDVITIDNETGTATVTRPTDEDTEVTLTAIVTDAEGNTDTKTITVKVLANTAAAADAAALSTDDITFASGDSADAVTGDFTLPITGEVNGTTTISWESDNTDVITIDNETGAATVTRPSDADTEVALTATFTDADGNTSTKTVTVTVVAQSSNPSATGTLDISFEDDGFVIHDNAGGGSGTDFGNSVAIDSNGKILVAGYSDSADDEDMVLWRYNSDGSLDTTFDSNGFVTHDNAGGGNDIDRGNSVVVDSIGKIVVAGYSRNVNGDNDMALWRYNSDGTLDTTFGGTGFVTHEGAAGGTSHDQGNSVVIDSNGKILVAGHSYDGFDPAMTLWRYNNDGTLDTTFDTDGIVSYSGAQWTDFFGNSAAIDSDGKILVAGYKATSADNGDMVLWRYDSDGSLDTTFAGTGFVTHHNAAGGDDTDQGNSVAIDSNGNILVTGYSDSVDFGQNNEMVLWRYSSNGTLDTTFGGTGFVIHNSAAGGDGQDYGNSVAIDSNGKILVAGSSANGSNLDMALWRYDTDGSLDTTFNTSGTIPGTVIHDNAAGGSGSDYGNSVAIDSNGKILVTGYSRNGSGNDDMVIWRYE